MKIGYILKFIFDEFVYGGYLLSLGASSIVFTSAILLNIKITWDFLAIAYLSAQAAYLYDRYTDFSKDYLTNSERTRHLVKKVKTMPLIISLHLIALFFILIFYSGISGIFFGFFISLLSLLYNKIFKSLTQSIIGFKNFFVSFIWALSAPFLAVYYYHSLDFSVCFIFLFVFLRWLVNTSFFDIKDIESDKKEGFLTLAIFWGNKKMICILSMVSVLAVIPIIFGVYLRLFPIYSLALFFTIPYSIYYFKKEEDQTINKSFLYNVIVDGEFILWSLVILLGKFLV